MIDPDLHLEHFIIGMFIITERMFGVAVYSHSSRVIFSAEVQQVEMHVAQEMFPQQWVILMSGILTDPQP
jgi:hypothetical protein